MVSPSATASPASPSFPTALPQKLNKQNNKNSNNKNKTNLLKVILGNCYLNCADHNNNNNNNNNNSDEFHNSALQFVELPGLQVIGLGALTDELSARERVYDTLEQFTTSRQRERFMRLGHVTTTRNDHKSKTEPTIATATATTTLVQMVPLDVWNQHYPQPQENKGRSPTNNNNNDSSSGLTRPVQTLVQQIQNHDYRSAKLTLSLQLTAQKHHPPSNNNNSPADDSKTRNHHVMTGITAHNLAVVKMLCGDIDDDVESIIDLLRQAIYYKEKGLLDNNNNTSSTNEDGDDDDDLRDDNNHNNNYDEEEVNQASELLAASWDELGIQYFGQGQFDQALQAFEQALDVLKPPHGTLDDHDEHPSLLPHDPQDFGGARAMVLNNIACCQFQLKQHNVAYETLQRARELQHSYLTTRSLSFHKDSHDDDDNDDHLEIGESKSHKDDNHLAATTRTSSPKNKSNPATVVVLADLELLYNAIVMGNCAYLCLCLKKYDQARSLLEEALLLQQSVLDNEDHRAIRDTRSNLEFTNAFHM